MEVHFLGSCTAFDIRTVHSSVYTMFVFNGVELVICLNCFM